MSSKPLRFTAELCSLIRLDIHTFGVGRVSVGGARRDRTDDLKLAKLALSQLSYGPVSTSRAPSQFATIENGGPGKI